MDSLEDLVERALGELSETGHIFVDTWMGLTNLGFDPNEIEEIHL